MLWPVVSRPCRWAYSEDSPTLSPEKVDTSDRRVQQPGAAVALDGLTRRAVGRRLGLAERHQGVARGLVTGGQQLAVALRQGADLGAGGEEGVAVLPQDVVPGGGRALGQLAQAGVAAQAERDRDLLHLDGTAELGPADLLEHHL